MLSLPFQMTARYVVEYGDDITAEEREAIDKVMDFDTLAEDYNPMNADGVKHDKSASGRDFLVYIIVWFKMGLRHPDAYIKAFNAMLSGWFSFSKYQPLLTMDWHNQLNSELIPEAVASRGSLSSMTSSWFAEYYENLYNIPMLNLPLTYAFYATLIPAFALCTLAQRRKKFEHCWLIVLPVLLSIALGCWLAPLSIHFEGVRYLYPVVYVTPLLLMAIRSVSAGSINTSEQES